MPEQVRFETENGIFIPDPRPAHREDEYGEAGFDVLIQMQREHFWYRGRHRLILNILNHELATRPEETLKAIDLGGGCGGWIEYLHAERGEIFDELALGDSSLRALAMAEPVVGDIASRYQVDLLDLPWEKEWDIVFLLDVLEHIPDHESVLRQVRKILRPGGILVVTTPALELFWTYNDVLVRHQRRYSKRDYRELAEKCELKLLRSDYFMFLLSPALVLSRLLIRPSRSATPEELLEHLERSHRIPARPVNLALAKVFDFEASLVNKLKLPWGTSILAVLQR